MWWDLYQINVLTFLFFDLTEKPKIKCWIATRSIAWTLVKVNFLQFGNDFQVNKLMINGQQVWSKGLATNAMFRNCSRFHYIIALCSSSFVCCNFLILIAVINSSGNFRKNNIIFLALVNCQLSTLCVYTLLMYK